VVRGRLSRYEARHESAQIRATLRIEHRDNSIEHRGVTFELGGRVPKLRQL